MAKIISYRDLEVWQKAMDLVESVYRLSAKLPDTERYGLRSQVQRAAVSIPSNIAEGFGRGSPVDYVRLLTIARTSLMELETQLALLVRLGMAERDPMLPVWEQAQTVGRMLTALRKSVAKAGTKAQGPSPKAHQ